MGKEHYIKSDNFYVTCDDYVITINISKNIDIVDWCHKKICQENSIVEKRGKNYYVTVDGCVITVNASSYTIITVKKIW